ncbi:MAG: pilus assembly protein HicB [Muribaculaceae bacterium]
MKLQALVERNDNNFYAITTEQPVAGNYFGGYGYSVQEAKADYMECVREMIEMAKEEGKDVPNVEDIEIDFRYDIPSFFNFFDWINISAFAKQVGINESKMRAYKSGLATASEKTVSKILRTVKAMGAELSSVTL